LPVVAFQWQAGKGGFLKLLETRASYAKRAIAKTWPKHFCVFWLLPSCLTRTAQEPHSI